MFHDLFKPVPPVNKLEASLFAKDANDLEAVKRERDRWKEQAETDQEAVLFTARRSLAYKQELDATLDRLEAAEHELAQWRLGVTTEMTSEMSFKQSLEQWQRWYARLKARFGVRDV